MTNYDSLDHGKKQDLKNQLIKYATSFGGKNHFLCLIEALRLAHPHPLMAKGACFRFNKGIIKEEYSLWRMEPFKWWVLEKELNFPNELGTSLDMSHSFTCINIFGDNATLLLNRHLPIDLRENKFPTASSASSAIHHVSIKLLKISNHNYYLLIPRGFGLSIWEILLETAKQFGYEIK